MAGWGAWARLAALVVGLASAPGCAMAKGSSSYAAEAAEAPAMASAAPAPMGAAEYDFAEEEASIPYPGDGPLVRQSMGDMAASPARVEIAMERDSKKLARKEDARANRETASVDRGDVGPPPAPPTSRGGKAKDAATDPAPQAQDAASPGEPAVATEDPGEVARMMVYTAALVVSVYDREGAMKRAEELPLRYGGYVQSLADQQIVLKIPAARLRAALQELQGFGVVMARNLQAEDVTEQVVDLDSRISSLRGTQQALLSLLQQAKTVEEALHVREALDRVTMELEALLARRRALGDRIAFSTVTVDFVPRGPDTRPGDKDDPFPWVDSLGVESTAWR